jgi:hypothetical protein
MWWCVKMTAPNEVHVYPMSESHILNADLCNCLPEVRRAGAVRMVVHKKMGTSPLKPAFRAHWIH